MAKWRAEIDIAFDTEDEILGLANIIEGVKGKVYKFSGLPIAEATETKFRYHLCYHDEVPPKPCGDYKNIDFSAPAEVHLDTKGDLLPLDSLNVKVDVKP